MTWTELEDGVDREHMESYCIAQDTYKGHMIFSQGYSSYNHGGCDSPDPENDIDSLGYYKIDPTDFSGAIGGRNLDSIPSNYCQRYVAAVYNNYLITFGTRHVGKMCDFSMFFLNLDCKNTFLYLFF